jgi:hypothetical protein
MFANLISFSILMRYVINCVLRLKRWRYYQVHHILAEIIQGGLVLETNVDEIDLSGAHLFIFLLLFFWIKGFNIIFSLQYRKQHGLGRILIYHQTHYHWAEVLDLEGVI